MTAALSTFLSWLRYQLLRTDKCWRAVPELLTRQSQFLAWASDLLNEFLSDHPSTKTTRAKPRPPPRIVPSRPTHWRVHSRAWKTFRTDAQSESIFLLPAVAVDLTMHGPMRFAPMCSVARSQLLC